MNNAQLRKIPIHFEGAEFLLPFVDAFLVGYVSNLISIKGIIMTFQSRQINHVFLVVLLILDAPFAIVAVGNTHLPGSIPKKTGAWSSNRVIMFFVSVKRSVKSSIGMARVCRSPEPSDIIAGGGCHGPEMAVGTYIAINKKIIKEDEFTRECMLVWGNLRTEKDQ